MVGIPSLSLQGKVAIVTGAKRGLGKAIALGFAEAGADVVVTTRLLKDDKDDLGVVAGKIKKLGRRSLSIQADIAIKADVDTLVKKTMDEFGTIDILVNNAGIGTMPTITETSEDEWQKVMDVNLKGYYLCSQAVAKVMIERKKGNIISMASLAGLRGVARRNTYNISKAGVIMLTRVLAWDLGKYNIRANAIAPSRIKTELTRPYWEDPKAVAAYAATVPLGRLGEVEEVVGPALFLASDASSYITGHTIVLDGGIMA